MSNAAEHNESDLLALISQGDRKAFSIIFEKWYPRLAAYVLRITESRETTEEIVLDAFTRIWLDRKSVGQINNFQGYLFVMTRNIALNELRSAAARIKREARYAVQQVQLEKDFTDVLIEKQTGQIVEQALAVLSTRQREVWIMNKRNSLSYSQIANQLKISNETVKTHLQAANRQLIEYLRTREQLLLLIAEGTILQFIL